MRSLINHLFCFTLAVLMHLLVLFLAGAHLMRAVDDFLPELELSAVELTLEGPAPDAIAAAATAAASQPAPVVTLPLPELPAAPHALPQALPLPEPAVVSPPQDLPALISAPLPELPEVPPAPVAATERAAPQEQVEKKPLPTPDPSATTTTKDPVENTPAQSAAPESGGSASGQIDAHPSLDRTIRPVYPLGARRRKEEGTVVLDVTVGTDGRATAVTLVTSSGFPELDRAAQQAAARACFKPGKRDGQTILSTARLTLIFRLRD